MIEQFLLVVRILWLLLRGFPVVKHMSQERWAQDIDKRILLAILRRSLRLQRAGTNETAWSLTNALQALREMTREDYDQLIPWAKSVVEAGYILMVPQSRRGGAPIQKWGENRQLWGMLRGFVEGTSKRQLRTIKSPDGEFRSIVVGRTRTLLIPRSTATVEILRLTPVGREVMRLMNHPTSEEHLLDVARHVERADSAILLEGSLPRPGDAHMRWTDWTTAPARRRTVDVHLEIRSLPTRFEPRLIKLDFRNGRFGEKNDYGYVIWLHGRSEGNRRVSGDEVKLPFRLVLLVERKRRWFQRSGKMKRFIVKSGDLFARTDSGSATLNAGWWQKPTVVMEWRVLTE